MPLRRCKFCAAPPLHEIAVSSWTEDPNDLRRDTIMLCGKHLQRVRKAGAAGHEHKGMRYKEGFW